MVNVPTIRLIRSLSQTNSLQEYMGKNSDFFIDKSLAEYLGELLIENGLRKSQVIKNSELSDDYGYQIFSGVRKSPSRDKLICLCIGMDLTEEETDGLLKLAGLAPLYPKNKRDSIIIFGIQEGQSVCELNLHLFEYGEQTLG